MDFASDNWAGAHPEIAAALVRHASQTGAAYGGSLLDRAVEKHFCEIFERDVAVFFVGTGTAANAVSMAAVARPGSIALCHAQAHMVEDECGAPEFLAPGLRVRGVPGGAGKIDADILRSEIQRIRAGSVHAGQPVAVSVTQATEWGTIYAPAEIAAIAEIAQEHGL